MRGGVEGHAEVWARSHLDASGWNVIPTKTLRTPRAWVRGEQVSSPARATQTVTETVVLKISKALRWHIKAELKMNGVRQYQVANRAGISPTYLAHLLNDTGQIRVRPEDPRVVRLAKSVGFSVDQAFEDDGTPYPERSRKPHKPRPSDVNDRESHLAEAVASILVAGYRKRFVS